MAIGTPVILVAAWNSGDASSYTLTPSPAPTRGRLLVCFSDTSHGTLTAPDSTPTGLGLVWTLRGSQAHPTDVRKIFAHTAPVSADLTSGDVTLTMTGANLPSTGTGHALVQISGVDLAQPVVRTVSTNANSTSVTVTLPTPLSVANRWLVFKSHRANEVTTPRAAPWSEISDVAGASPTRAANVQWLPGVVTSTGILETAASASWVTSGQASIIALELRAATDRQFWVFGAVAGPTTHSLAATLTGEGELATALTRTATVAAAFAGDGALTTVLTRTATLASALAGDGSLTAVATRTATLSVALAGDGFLGADDDFERADGSLGAAWTDIFGPFAIVSGQAIGPAGTRRTETFPQDTASEIDVELGADYAEVGMYVRGESDGSGTLLGGWYSTGPTTGNYYLSADTLQTVSGAAPGTSITLRLEVAGSTARLLVNGGVIFTDDAGSAAGSYITIFDAGTNPSPIEAWRGPGPALTVSSGATTHSLAAVLDGDGTMTAALSRTATVASALAGDGAMTAVLTRTATFAAAFAGDGAMTVVLTRTATLLSTLAGDGDLSATFQGTTPTHQLAAVLEGDGTLTVVLGHTATLAAALAGDGTLTAVLTRSTFLAAALAGDGTLTTVMTVEGETVLGTVRLTAASAGCTLVAI